MSIIKSNQKNKLKSLITSFVLGILLVSSSSIQTTATANAQDINDNENWQINVFKADIQINKDSSMIVNEHIETDFSNSPHHGIYRNILVHNVNDQGIRKSYRVKVLGVTDEKGRDWPYSVSNSGDNLNIKIGDPDIILHSTATYNLKYQVDDAIGFFSDHDELYWNIIGFEWLLPLINVEVKVSLPESVNKAKLQSKCYTGTYGSKEENCVAKVVDGKTFTYKVQKPRNQNAGLDPNEGFSIVASFPKVSTQISASGAITESPLVIEPPFTEKIFNFFYDNWGFAIPIVVLMVMFFLWYTKGRDPKGDHTAIMPLYTAPDNLTPAEIGTVVDERADMEDITATIVDLAVRGFINIKEINNKVLLFNNYDYELTFLKDLEPNRAKLQQHEITMLESLFPYEKTIKLSDLKNKFYKDLPTIKKNVYDEVVKKGYFLTSPDKVRNLYIAFGVGTAFFGFMFLNVVTAITGQIAPGVGLIISGILIAIFGNIMPVKTKKGVELRYKILGLEEFIKTAETDRLKFQEKENIFEKLLPYAMVLGIAEKWTKAFEGIYKNPPSWYSSSDPNFGSHFNSYYFYGRLNSMGTSMSSTMNSRPSSSGSGMGGGGFSGGGGGGGGGGGW